jgi:hypothetical protein
MTTPPSPTPGATGPAPQSRRATVVFLAVCLLVAVLIAAGLHFLGPR